MIDACLAALLKTIAASPALADFERRYHLSSDEFYRRYQAGQTDDRLDYTEWAALIQMVNRLPEHQRLSGR